MVMPVILVTIVTFFLVVLETFSKQLVAKLQQWLRPQSISLQLKEKGEELKTLLKDIANTSAQDQFALHSRLSRKKIKVQAEYDGLVSLKGDDDASVSNKFNQLQRVGVLMVNAYLMYHYRSVAMFRLPPDTLKPFGWVLAFPFNPTGTIGFIMWVTLCRRASKAVLGL